MSELDNVQYRNIIPAYASLDEAALYVIERGELEFNEMMRHIGLTELGVLETTGTQMVYEETKLKSLIDTIVGWLKQRWADITGLFNKALNFFKQKSDEFKKKTQDKKLDKLKKKVEFLKDKEYGKTYEYSQFENIVNGTGVLWDALNKFEKGINDLQATFMNYKDDETATEVNDMREKMDTMKSDLFSAFNLDNSAKESDIKAKVTEWIRGKEVTINKAYIQSNIDSMFNSATDYNKTAKSVKKQLNKIKKDIDNDIKAVRKERKTANESYLNAYLPYLKFGKNVTTAIAGATISAIKEKMSVDQRIILKLIVANTGKEEKEDGSVKTESAVVESSTIQTELASLFNF